MSGRVKHSGPNTKFCVLCLSGEHERIDEETPEPPLPAPIHTHSQWCWEPLRPLLKARVRITDTRWDGEAWWIETEALENSRMRLAGRRRWDALDSFIESAVAIDPDL